MLSACIITYNCAEILPACLASLAFADEIVVVDSGSTDGTVEVALQAGARVISQPWLGFGAQKQFAVDSAKHDWVLCVDSDERVSEALRASILAALHNPTQFAWMFPRRNRFLGRYLKHGEGYPDWSLRLFHRQHARWSEDPVHEKVITLGTVGRLQGDLLHDSAETLDAYLAKQNRYTTIAARELFRQGERPSAARVVVSPAFRFIKFYLCRLGFLDGLPGLVHIGIGCFNTFAKYSKLLDLMRQEKSDPNNRS